MAIQEVGQGQQQGENPHPKTFSRRKFLGLAGGAVAAAGATALGISLSQGGEEESAGGLVVPGIASDGDGSGGESGNLPLKTGETPIPTETPLPTPEPTKTPEKEPTTLKEAVPKGFYIGVGMGGYGSASDYAKLTSIQTSEFNAGEIFSGWGGQEPQRGSINLNTMKNDLALTKRKGMRAMGGALIYSKGLPAWFIDLPKAEKLKAMENRIISVAEAANGGFDSIIIRNEAGRAGDVIDRDIGVGSTLVNFEVADAVFPEGTRLVYNDFNNHVMTGPRSNRYEKSKWVADELNKKGYNFAIGIQSTWHYPDIPTEQELIDTYRSFQAPVVITEAGVNMANAKFSAEERLEIQKRAYVTMLSAALKSGVCDEFYIFQIVDRLAYWETRADLPGFSTENDPTPFDDSFQPKPAYFGIKDTLRDFRNNS